MSTVLKLATQVFAALLIVQNMFLAIQVEFGPHEADWWMVGVTAASVLVSLAVAIVAIWNGRTASRIANSPSGDAERMRVWLSCQLGEINKLAKKRDDHMAEIYEVAKEVRKRLAEWNRSEWSPPN